MVQIKKYTHEISHDFSFNIVDYPRYYTHYVN